MVIIPVLLIVLAMWLWPVMRQVYSLPDSAVPTYRQALKNIVPPGVGRLTRTDVIERALAGVLGELSDAAQTADSAEMPQLLKVLKFNSAMGRWAAAVMILPRSGRLSLLNWGIRPENLPVVNKAFSRWSLDRIAADISALDYSLPRSRLFFHHGADHQNYNHRVRFSKATGP